MPPGFFCHLINTCKLLAMITVRLYNYKSGMWELNTEKMCQPDKAIVLKISQSADSVEDSQGMTKVDKGNVFSKIDSHKMFDRIAARYDLLNHVLSFGQDLAWRAKAGRLIRDYPHDTVLDLACGTCDLLLSAFRYNKDIRCGIGIDMADNMLRIGFDKIRTRGLARKICLAKGDGMDLPVADCAVDFAMISFGIRNMADPAKSLSELYRILKQGGRLAVLEFSLPKNRLIKAVYLIYFRKILPRIGGLISGDRFAYSYLNRTVEEFYYGKQFCDMMGNAGFANIEMKPLTFGIVTIYVGEKI